jgi:hypothetical protein
VQSYNPASSRATTRYLVDATSAPAIGSVGTTRSSSLRENQSVAVLSTPTTNTTTHLDARLAQQTTLEVRHRSGHLVPHRRLAVLGACRLCTAARGRRAVGASASGAGALGGQGAFAGVAVVADAAGVCGGLPGGGGGAGERVSGRRLCDAGGLRLLAGQAVHEAGLCGGGGGACAGHGVLIEWSGVGRCVFLWKSNWQETGMLDVSYLGYSSFIYCLCAQDSPQRRMTADVGVGNACSSDKDKNLEDVHRRCLPPSRLVYTSRRTRHAGPKQAPSVSIPAGDLQGQAASWR